MLQSSAHAAGCAVYVPDLPTAGLPGAVAVGSTSGGLSRFVSLLSAAPIVAGLVVLIVGSALVYRRRSRQGSGGRGRGSSDSGRFGRAFRFPFASVHDDLPELESGPVIHAMSVAMVDEEDWRQVEFVLPSNEGRVGELMQDIRDFRVANRLNPGYRSVFVRPELPSPLSTIGLPLDDIVEELGADALLPLCLRSGERVSRVIGGYAVEITGVGFVYGLANGGCAASLAFGVLVARPQLQDLEPLTRLCAQYGLLLVDWIGLHIVPGGDGEGLQRWLEES
jgi:hypothetical protein